jgi:prepilin-type N-terminal cleavage/methylation domain-containing protein
MKSASGLTLIEVLVALVVLAVGVLAAATMQATSLRASNNARAIQEVTKLAEGEIAFRRQANLTTSPGNLATCQSVSSLPTTDHTCQVAVRPCQLSSTTPPAMSCPVGGVATADQVADQVTVTVTGQRDETITLRTVKAR